MIWVKVSALQVPTGVWVHFQFFSSVCIAINDRKYIFLYTFLPLILFRIHKRNLRKCGSNQNIFINHNVFFSIHFEAQRYKYTIYKANRTFFIFFIDRFSANKMTNIFSMLQQMHRCMTFSSALFFILDFTIFK